MENGHLYQILTSLQHVSRIKKSIKENILTYFFRVNIISSVLDGFAGVFDKHGKKIPKVIQLYRNKLGFVDHGDRMLHLYWSPHRNIKWTSALLQFFLKITVNNTWVIYRYFHENCSLKDVMLSIIDHLAGDHTFRTKFTQASSLKSYSGHWPKKTDKKQCVHCYNLYKKKSNTTFECSSCQVHLHPECFEEYHSNQ